MSVSTGTRGETVPTVPPGNPVVDTADVTALLERGRTLSTPVLKAAVDRLAPPMDTVAAYHFGWIDAHGTPTDADSGKAVRPALALISAEVAGVAPEVGIPGAVAVELVHNFSLLHDDLMDGDEQRRHRDTVWKVHGPAQAILVGDALFALANELLLELGTVEAGRERLRRAPRVQDGLRSKQMPTRTRTPPATQRPTNASGPRKRRRAATPYETGWPPCGCASDGSPTGCTDRSRSPPAGRPGRSRCRTASSRCRRSRRPSTSRPWPPRSARPGCCGSGRDPYRPG